MVLNQDLAVVHILINRPAFRDSVKKIVSDLHV